MKTYCKGVDISDPTYIQKALVAFVNDKCKKGWAIRFFSARSGKSIEYVKENLRCNSEFLKDTLKLVAEEMAVNLKNGTVKEHIVNCSYGEKIIRYVKIKDSGSGKERPLGLECTILRFYEVLAQYAAEPMFNAKVGEYQCASIKGKGQSYGKKAVKRWLSSDPDGTKVCCQSDVSKCYPSIPHTNLIRLLSRDLGKAKMLLNLYITIIGFYEKYPNPYTGKSPEEGILIGSPASKDLCNYYLSYAYHYASEKLVKKTVRRGKEKVTRLISHVIIYADDTVFYGSNKKNVRDAMLLFAKYMKEFLGLTIKPDWRKFRSQFKDKAGKIRGSALDFMGYVFHSGEVLEKNYSGKRVKHKKVWVTIRASIFLRARRNLRKFCKMLRKRKKVPIRLARGIASQLGWYKNTNSYKHRKKRKVDKIIRIARRIVSDCEKKKKYNTDKYFKMWRICHA